MSLNTRILLYSHNTRGLGHAARMVSLAWGIYTAIPEASILCCTGGMQGLADILPPHADYVKMPSFDAKEQNGHLVLFPARLQIERNNLIAIRRSILFSVTKNYNPAVLIADYTPLGKDNELESSVAWLRHQENRLILVGIRDMISGSEHIEVNLLPALRQYFDAALVYSDPNWNNFIVDNNISTDVKKKFIHTGYVVNDKMASRTRDNIRRELGMSTDAHLVVLGLGGGKDANELLNFAIEAWEVLIPKLQDRGCLLILTGPYIRPNHWQWAQERTSSIPTIRLARQVQYPLEYFQASDLYIGACGYNTFTEVMCARIPAIFIPRIQVDSDEQLIRANGLQHKGHWEVIDSRLSSVEDLAKRMIGILTVNPPKPDPIDLNGADNVGTFISRWIQKKL